MGQAVYPSILGQGMWKGGRGVVKVGVGVVNFWYDLLLWPSGLSCYGLLEWSSAVAYWSGLLLWPSGWVVFWLKVTFCFGLLVCPNPTTPPPHTHTWLPKWVVCILLKCIFVYYLLGFNIRINCVDRRHLHECNKFQVFTIFNQSQLDQ